MEFEQTEIDDCDYEDRECDAGDYTDYNESVFYLLSPQFRCDIDNAVQEFINIQSCVPRSKTELDTVMNDVNSCNEQQKANAYVYMGGRLRTLKFFEQAYCLFYEAFCISHCWNFLNSEHSTRRQVFHNSVLGMVQMLSNDVSRKELNQRSIVAAKSEAELTDICRFMMDRFPEHVDHWADRL